MGWDAAALIMVELCVSVGLIERCREKASCSVGFVDGYKEAMEERVLDKYAFSKDSEALGSILFKDEVTGQRLQADILQLSRSTEEILINQDLSEEQKLEKIERNRSNLLQLLTEMRELNSGNMPFKELDILIERLKYCELT